MAPCGFFLNFHIPMIELFIVSNVGGKGIGSEKW